MENLDICLVAYPTHIIINDMVVIYRKLYIYGMSHRGKCICSHMAIASWEIASWGDFTLIGKIIGVRIKLIFRGFDERRRFVRGMRMYHLFYVVKPLF